MAVTSISKMAERIELWPVEKLQPYAKNARTHSDEQVEQIAASMREFGFTNPILVDSQDGIIAGHGRLMAAKRLQLPQVPVIVLDHLTDEQRRAYILADNKLALNAGWDNQLLAEELLQLQAEGYDLELTGFTDEELDDLLPDTDDLPPGDADEDAVPEVPADPVTKLGDVWVLGKHRLMCGDSTSVDAVDKLMDGGKADMVFTDPPYGIAVVHSKGNYGSGVLAKAGTYSPVIGDENTDVAVAVVNYCLSLEIPVQIFWGANYFAQALPDGKKWLVWDKKRPEGTTFSDCELAWTNAEGGVKKYEFFWHGMMQEGEREKRVHPTQKPVGLIEKIFSDYKGEVVIDFFGGSGSTLIACEKTSRIARLMELDPKYCDVIVKRWQDFTGKQATLEQDNRTFDEVAGNAKQAA